MSNVRENLIAAKTLIDTPEKWIKGDFSDGDGCLCALGAVHRSDDGDMFVGFRMVDALLDALPESFEASSVPSFNDDPGTTHSDIMALFDRAIAAQDAQP